MTNIMFHKEIQWVYNYVTKESDLLHPIIDTSELVRDRRGGRRNTQQNGSHV